MSKQLSLELLDEVQNSTNFLITLHNKYITPQGEYRPRAKTNEPQTTLNKMITSDIINKNLKN
jgi:hypothetical protein